MVGPHLERELQDSKKKKTQAGHRKKCYSRTSQAYVRNQWHVWNKGDANTGWVQSMGSKNQVIIHQHPCKITRGKMAKVNKHEHGNT